MISTGSLSKGVFSPNFTILHAHSTASLLTASVSSEHSFSMFRTRSASIFSGSSPKYELFTAPSHFRAASTKDSSSSCRKRIKTGVIPVLEWLVVYSLINPSKQRFLRTGSGSAVQRIMKASASSPPIRDRMSNAVTERKYSLSLAASMSAGTAIFPILATSSVAVAARFSSVLDAASRSCQTRLSTDDAVSGRSLLPRFLTETRRSSTVFLVSSEMGERLRIPFKCARASS